MGEPSACLVRSFPHGKSSAFTRDLDSKAYYDSFCKKRSAVDDSDTRNSGSLNKKKSKISPFSTSSTKGDIYQAQNSLKNSEAKTPLKATFEASNKNASPNIQGNSSRLQLVLAASSLSLGWWDSVKWSAFTHDRKMEEVRVRKMEEVKRYCTLGLVAEMKAYFQAQFKKRRAAALFEQQNDFPNIQGNSSVPHGTSTLSLGSFHCIIWSAFTRDRKMEEVKRYCKLGLVAEMTAYFEAQFKKRRAAALLEQKKAVAKDGAFEEVSEHLIAVEKNQAELTEIIENDEGSGDDIVSKKEDKAFNEDDFDKRKSASLNEKKSNISSSTKLSTNSGIFKCAPPVKQIMHCQNKNSVKNSEAKSRLKATSRTLETLKSMRVLKLHSWELMFMKKLLQLRETETKRLVHYHTPSKTGFAIEIEPGEFVWQSRETKRPTSKLMAKLRIMKGSKVAIFGSVASGKTSFLCVLGEIPRISDLSIKPFGSKAFVLQSSWIQKGINRDNILFAKEMNRALYENVVGVCALNQDIEMWTEERRLNLSGEQKQRIQMARALYSNTDIYLLDDPFSAVDAHTEAHMFKKCLMQLLHEKAVVCVTHQLEFLDASDLVLVVKGRKLIELENRPSGKLINQVGTPKCVGLQKVYHQAAAANQIVVTEINCVDLSRSNKAPEQIPFEVMETGRVIWHVYATAAYRGALVSIILLFQMLQMANNYWISWGLERDNRVTKEHLIKIFALCSFLILGSAILLSIITIETSQWLFHGMIKYSFPASLSFFVSTPSCRILIRSSTDQSIVDKDIPCRLAGLAFALIKLLSIVVLMWQVPWQILFLFLIVFAIYHSVWYQAYYISTAIELPRMSTVSSTQAYYTFKAELDDLQKEHGFFSVFLLFKCKLLIILL